MNLKDVDSRKIKEQLEKDSEFLSLKGLLDYSLFVAVEIRDSNNDFYQTRHKFMSED